MSRRRPLRPLLPALLGLLAIPASLVLWAQTGPDTDPPQIHILESGADLTDGRLLNRAATPVIQVTDASAVTVTATLDGAAFTSGTQVAAEGTHQLAVTATDAAGNTASLAVGFEIDTTPPAFVEVLPANDSLVAAAQVALQGQVSGAASVTVDGQAATLSGQSFTAGPYTLSEGVRTWTIVAADPAGNTATWTHRITRDSQAPTVSISQPAAAAVVKDGAIDVVGSAQDTHLAGVTVNGVAATVTGSTWLAPHVPLAEGSNTLTAHAEDRAGNVAEASRAVVRDSQAPALAITDPATGTVVPGGTITLRGTASDPHLDRVEVNGSRAQLAGGVWSLAVALAEGNNDFTVQAFDSVGNAATAAVSVTRDSQAPAVTIEQPAQGAHLNAQSVTVSGTVAQKPGITVTVNGSAATVTGGTFSLAGVSLVEGDNTLIARAKDSVGNEGTYTRKVVRDTVAPTLLSSDPAAGALALPVDAALRLTFSEAMATPAAGSWRLETGAGQSIAATAALAGDVLTVQPSAALPSSTQVRLVLTAALTDLAGNPLASPPTLTFFTADVTAPGAPVLDPTPPRALCAPAVTLAGHTEAGAIVRVQGGAAAAEARAGDDGKFAVSVQLVPDQMSFLRLNAVDPSGNVSDAVQVQVTADCQPPRVLSADRQGNAFRIVFSEAVTAASVGPAVQLSSAQGTVAGSVSLGTDGKTATFTPSAALPAGALRLDVSADVHDLAGNAMGFPWSQVFGAEGGSGFVSGTAIDDATGRPLAGARVVVIATNGTPLPDPKPEQVTGPDGRFRIPVPAGTHDLTIGRPGYTPSFRVVTTTAGQGIDIFDPRLTPAVAPQTIGAAGGAAGTAPAPVLTLPAGALAADTAIAVTPLSEQGLPSPLPYGWSPRGAAWVDLAGAALLAQSTLSLPVESPDGTSLAVVHLDLATLQWRVLDVFQASGGSIAVPLPAAAAGLTDGAYAAVEGDDGATAPPAAVAGAVLGGSPRPSGADVTSATLSFDPQEVLPSQTSLATAGYATAQPVASGLPLTLLVQESLTLLDDSARRQAPYEADLILYHAPGGAARSRFRLRPSDTAQTLPLKMGAEDVTLRSYGDAVEGNVIGADGGTVSDDEGDRVDLPAGAVADPTAVTLTRKTPQDLPLAVPAGTELAGVVSLDLGGRSLLAPAALSLALSPAPATGDKGLLLQAVDLEAGPAWRPVAALLATTDGWTTASIDPADLPWPGVRDEGIYAFVRLTGSFGYLRGTVFDVGGAALAGAQVHGSTVSWLQIAGADGKYVLPTPVGALSVTAENPITGNQATAGATIPAADARVDLDLHLAATGPHVVAISPADGAVDVPQGIQPTVRFSKAVDSTTVAAAVQLLQGGAPVAVDLDVQGGALLRVTPRATLLPGTVYELRVGTGVRDLQGNPLDAPAAATFTTRRIIQSNDLDLSRVFLVEPDANGEAHVTGRPGAVPAGALVFVENLSALANTPSVTAGTDGSFSLSLQAALTHRLVLHVLIPGSNEVVTELTPFHTADLKGAYVGAQAVTFTTGDGVTVKLVAGTFDGPTRVRVEPHPVADVPLLSRQQLAPVYAFDLDFSGAQANKAPQITIPLPAGAPTPAGGFYLVNRVVEALGERHWMMHDLMVPDGHGHLTTDFGASTAVLAQPQAVVASLGDPFMLAAAVALPVGKASPLVPEHKKYVPGSSFAGQYQVEAPLIPLGFTVFPSFNMNVLVESWDRGLEGIFTSLNQSVERLLEYDGILIPALLDKPLHLVGRDLQTGFRVFDVTVDPPAGTDPVVLPRDQFGDKKPPFPIAGSPIRFFLLNLGAGDEQELAPGIKMKITPGTATETQRSVTITGEDGSTTKESDIQLIGLDDDVHRSTTSSAKGGFSLGLSMEKKNRYVLAIGAQIASDDPLEISFNEAIAKDFPGVEVKDAGGRKLSPRLDPLGSQETVVIHPEAGWRAGETYTLHLAPALADDAGNKWDKTLDVRFKIPSSRELDTYSLDNVHDVARLGSWLFVAGDTDGLVILDASDPAHLKNLISGDIKFPFPYNDPVRAVAIDPHGRVLVAGGGVNGFGQLKIFDPLALDPSAVAANPDDPTVRYAAFKGSTIISDKLGGVGTQLPAGTPRRLAVLSNDQNDEWKVGDAAPAGLEVQVSDPPGENGEVTITVRGENGTKKHPVSLFDLDLGRWKRVDVDDNNHYELSFSVRPGDHMRLLRNVSSLAYVATTGVGVEVVDVGSFYNEDHTTPQIAVQSDVRGIYSGYQDPNLILCGQHELELGTALLDLGALYDPDNLHPLTVVGLVGNKGLALLDNNPGDVSRVSFISDACAQVDGNANVTGLQLLQKYRFDLDDDGKLKPEEARDYALVTHRSAGLLIFDITDRQNAVLVGRIRLPGSAAHLVVDPEHRRAYVSGYAGGLYVIDLDHKPTVDLLDANGDGTDDRVLETVTLKGNTNNSPAIIAELGIALAGGSNRGLTSLTVSGPLVQAIAKGDDGAYRPITRLAPFGVPTAKESSDPNAQDMPGSFFLQAHLPGTLGATVRVDLLSLTAGGKEILGLATSDAVPEGMPKTKLEGTTDGIELTRLSENPYEEGYNIYLSKEIAAIADVRAAQAYHRTPKEDDDCTRCDKVPEKALEILSGDSIAVRFPEALRTQLQPIYDPEVLDQSQIAIGSVHWEVVPALRQEPTLNPSHGRGDAFPGTLLHSGELTLQQTDLFLKGRGFDLAFTRVYRSQTIGSGPLGPGWDFTYDQRLRELPNGDVEYYDGTGRRETFEKQDDGTLQAPTGRFVTLDRAASGWILTDPRHNLARFDRYGRLTAISDAVKDADDTGNEMLFGYDLSSRLVRITDTLKRVTLLGYDDKGRLEKIDDPTGREVTFKYDTDGRLQEVHSPKIETGQSQFADGLITRYAYESAGGALAATLNQRDNVTKVTDGRDVDWLQILYGDGDHDGRADEVQTETWGDGTVSLQYDFDAHKTTVYDRLGHDTEYEHDDDGHPTKVTDPAHAVTSFEYDDEGLVTSMTEPMGRKTSYTYGQSDQRRSRGNLTQLKVTPGTGGTGGSAGQLVTNVTYDGKTNQPTQITDPRGTSTSIARDDFGQATAIVRGAGTPAASTTQISYNKRGQVEKVTNPNGHVTHYEYFDTEGDKSYGYLQNVTVDDGGLNLKTSYEVDERGNVTRMIDPRGNSHERTWNEVDWLVDASEPLGYETKYQYDAAGNMIQQDLPFGDGGGETTKTRVTYGKLGEVLTTDRDITPAGEVAHDEYTYDADLNVVTHVAPEHQTTRWTYDQRNLPTQVVHGTNLSTESMEYDDEGRLTAWTDGRSSVWHISYDGYGRTTETLDPLGNKSSVTYDDGSNVTERKAFETGDLLLADEETVYDALNRPTIQRRKLFANGGGATDNIETQLQYDKVGHVVQITDPLQRVSLMTYDGAERLNGQTDAAGNVTVMELDESGNVTRSLVSERNPQGGTVAVEHTATYDELNRRVSATNGEHNTTEWTYDINGNVLLATDPEGHSTERTYDAFGRVLTETQPGGITVTYEYDHSGRPISLKDALQQTTTWDYDDLNRRTRTTYPDNTYETYDYDGAGGLIHLREPRGTIVEQTYDAAGRLTARNVPTPNGVIGPLSETYSYDGLDRLVRAQSGDLITERTYDSLSRLISEKNGDKTIAYKLDKAGNATKTTFPSGHEVDVTYDPLDLPLSVAAAGESIASYGWRGTGLPVQKNLGNGVSGTAQYDLAGRMTDQAFNDPQNGSVFQEKLAWSPRDLKVAQSRDDLNGAGFKFAYDEASRVTEAARSIEPVPTPNNTTSDPSALAGLANKFTFQYDTAQNLIERVEVAEGVVTKDPLPTDSSGRNRPSMIGLVPLEWDTNGNLVRKGNQRYQYDYRNRLTRVTDLADNTIATYVYDVFNRRVSKTVGGEVQTVTWDGWQPVEDYKNGKLDARRVYGAGLDEVVSLENSPDADGNFQQRYFPVYDETGNMVAATGRDGKPVEKYAYSPYGEQTITVDLTPPAIEQVRIKNGAIWLEMSEEILAGSLTQGLANHKLVLTDVGTQQELIVQGVLPVQDGRQARRRIWIVPATTPAAGAQLHLSIQREAIKDLFLNKLAAAYDLDITWPEADAVLVDNKPPALDIIGVADGKLRIGLTEEPDPATFDAIQVDGATTTWTLSDDHYTLTANSTIGSGTHTLAIGTALKDLGGNALAEPYTTTFNLQGANDARTLFALPDPRQIPLSAIKNTLGFHGQPKDLETGFVYMRNRYYDPQLGRFITADPLGYVDGPSAYAFAGNDPVNQSDPLGLEAQVSKKGYIIITDVHTGQTKKYSPSEVQKNGDEIRKELGLKAGLSGAEADAIMVKAGAGDWVGNKKITAVARGVDASVKQQLKFAGKTYVVVAAGAVTGGVGSAVLGTSTAAVVTTGALSGVASQGASDLLERKRSSVKQYVGAALLGAGGGVLAHGLSMPESVGPGSFNPEVKAASSPSVVGKQYLYRGVSANHPEIEAARRGSAIPGDVNGTVTPEEHNYGGFSSESPYTSWTREYDVAHSHAIKEGPGGVILRVEVGPPAPGDEWSWMYSPDIYGEQEVLLKGVRHGAEVLKP